MFVDSQGLNKSRHIVISKPPDMQKRNLAADMLARQRVVLVVLSISNQPQQLPNLW